MSSPFKSKFLSFLLFFILLIWNFKVEAQNNDYTNNVVFEKTTIDLGTINQNELVTGKFRFTNKSSERVQIKEIKTSTGSLGAKADKTSIQPGETCEILITYQHRTSVNTFKKTIIVSFNNSPTTELVVTGKVNIKPEDKK